MSWMYGRSLSLLVLGFLLISGSLHGATVPDHPWCGTTRSGFAAQAAIHQDHQRRLDRDRGRAMRTLPEAARVGDVAVLVDDGSMVIHPNPLDLSNFGVQYVPQRRGGMVASPFGDPVSEEIGDRLPLGDDDAREVAFPRGFRFRFFGRVYTRMFVHSDGNLTFVAPDAASSERSLDRVLGGPPRIAPLFADLNPEAALGDGGVYVLATPARIVVTWLEVPVFGQINRNTFQAVLYSDGRISFAFGELAAQEAVVGIAPGSGGQVQLLDYTANLPSGVIRVGIAERFVRTRSFDHLAVAKAFFREFADVYDHLIVFLDFPQSLGGGFAFEMTVKNDVRGLGVGVFDSTAQVGSRGRLRSFVQMGTLSRYPDDPEAEVLGTNSTLDVLGQEAGHRWLSFLHFIDENGARSDALLGRDLAHWSFCHNSLASDMEGNEYREDGGERFTTIAATDRFSPLDQYAMGLIPAAQVPPVYYVEGCAMDRDAAPQIGVTVQGRRVDVTIHQIIAAEGARVPDSRRAPHSFNMAFILVAEAGQFPSAESIAHVDRIRAAWGPYFAQATDGNGAVNTTLVPRSRRPRR
jgi:hypothetical protein